MNTWKKSIFRGAIALPSMLALSGCPSEFGVGLESKLLSLTPAKTLVVGAAPHGLALAGGMLFTANNDSGDVSVIDPASDTVLDPLQFHGGKDQSSPNDPKVSPDGKFAVALDTKARLLRVIKGESKAEVKTVSLGMKPGLLVWAHADVPTAYVTLLPPTSGMTGHGLMMTHDAANVAKVTWPNGLEADAATSSLTVNREGVSTYGGGQIAAGAGYVAVSNTADNSVSFVEAEKPMRVTTLKEGTAPAGVAISAYGGGATLVIANNTSHSVTLYDLKAKAPITTLQVGSNPADIVLRGDGQFAYVTCKGAGEVAVIDLAKKSLHGKVVVGKGLADLPPKPNHIFVAQKPGMTAAHQQQIWVDGIGDDSVTVLDAETQKAIAVIAVGSGMHKMAFTDAKAYVSNHKSGNVHVIDRAVLR